MRVAGNAPVAALCMRTGIRSVRIERLGFCLQPTHRLPPGERHMLDGINRGGGGKFGVVVRRGEPTLAEANGEKYVI